jgi:hypothetical protein
LKRAIRGCERSIPKLDDGTGFELAASIATK